VGEYDVAGLFFQKPRSACTCLLVGAFCIAPQQAANGNGIDTQSRGDAGDAVGRGGACACSDAPPTALSRVTHKPRPG
jgi:hypothetical protein